MLQTLSPRCDLKRCYKILKCFFPFFFFCSVKGISGECTFDSGFSLSNIYLVNTEDRCVENAGVLKLPVKELEPPF